MSTIRFAGFPLIALLTAHCAPASHTRQIPPPHPPLPPVVASANVTTTGPHGEHYQTIVHHIPDPLPCDGHARTVVWKPEGAILVYSAMLWIGTTWAEGTAVPIIDTFSTASLSDGFVLAFLGLDHYAPFAGLHQIERPWPIPVFVNAGDDIRFQHSCTNYGATSPTSASQLILDWTYATI